MTRVTWLQLYLPSCLCVINISYSYHLQILLTATIPSVRSVLRLRICGNCTVAHKCQPLYKCSHNTTICCVVETQVTQHNKLLCCHSQHFPQNNLYGESMVIPVNYAYSVAGYILMPSHNNISQAILHHFFVVRTMSHPDPMYCCHRLCQGSF